MENTPNDLKFDPLTEKYAAQILAGLPPGQAAKQREQIFQMCHLLFTESAIKSQIEQLRNIDQFFSKSIDHIDLIWSLVSGRFPGANQCEKVWDCFSVRPEIQQFPIPWETQNIMEAVFRYFEGQQAAKNGPAAEVPPELSA